MSNYINQTIARQVAKKIAGKISEKIAAQKEELEELVSTEYLKTIPPQVLISYDLFKGYHISTSSIRLEGNGLNDVIYLKKWLPGKNSHCSVFLVENKLFAAKAAKGFQNLKKLEDKFTKICSEISATLLSLRTYKRIIAEFPEAAEFLPDNSSTINAIAVPINDIREQLKKFK